MVKVFVTGDLHGSAIAAKYKISQCKEANQDSFLIIAGDAGLEYDTRIMGSCKKILNNFPGKVIIMRGNHDNRYWQKHKNDWEQQENLLFQKKYDNIYYIKDAGGIYNIGGYDILFIPGAYSVDKFYRIKNNLPYNPQEQLTYMEQRKMLQMLDMHPRIDFVISHTAPLFLETFFKDLFLDFIDQSQIDNNMEKFLEEVYRTIGINNFQHWFFGHFHDNRAIQHKFTMLYNNVIELGDYIERQ